MKCGLVINGPDVIRGPLALLSGSFEEKLKKAKDLGFNGIELMVRDPAGLDWPRLKDSILSAGLEIPQVVTGELFGADGLSLVNGDPALRERSQVRVKTVIDLAAYLNTMINIGRLRGRLDLLNDTKDAWSLAHEYLYPIFKYSLVKGVKITFEPLNRYESDFINTAADAIRFINESGFKNIGVMLDTFHMNIEESTFENGFRTAGDKLWHVHIADSNRKYPGSGHIDFEPIFRTLKKIGFKKYISAELLPLPDPDTGAINTIEFLRKNLY